jgi:hypothetical protein
MSLPQNWFSKRTRRIRQYIQAARASLTPIRPGHQHGLPGELIVSLTSYPKRFRMLHLTLRSLLSQDMMPERLLLWVATSDAQLLPERVLTLERHGLQILTCDDFGPFKKLVPTLTAYPSAFILTADDDVFYPRDWLRRFVETYRHPKEILCQRARRIAISDGVLLPYKQLRVVRDYNYAGPILPEGVGGILYPPGSLPPETVNSEVFMQLCPIADDLWFYWMADRTGCTHRAIPPAGEFLAWPGSQRSALWRRNQGEGQNNEQFAALMAAYGLPTRLSGHHSMSVPPS